MIASVWGIMASKEELSYILLYLKSCSKIQNVTNFAACHTKREKAKGNLDFAVLPADEHQAERGVFLWLSHALQLCFSTFLMLRPFHVVLYKVMAPNHKIIFVTTS